VSPRGNTRRAGRLRFTGIANARPVLAGDTVGEKAMAAAKLGKDKRVTEVAGAASGAEPWMLGAPDQLNLMRRLEAEYLTLAETGCKVGIGGLVDAGGGCAAVARAGAGYLAAFSAAPGISWRVYLDRYNILCRKLTQERLYTTATIMASPRTAATTGEFVDLSELTGLKTFITSFAGHIPAEAAR
jgi:hypothetical protein